MKAPNIFLDKDGGAHLGDLGAARKAGGDADERTLSHLPYDLHEHDMDSTKPTAACDMLLLAVTLLERMGTLKLGKGALVSCVTGLTVVGSCCTLHLCVYGCPARPHMPLLL